MFKLFGPIFGEYFTFHLLWAKRDKKESRTTQKLDKMGLGAVIPIIYHTSFFVVLHVQFLFSPSELEASHSTPTTRILDLEIRKYKCDQTGHGLQ